MSVSDEEQIDFQTVYIQDLFKQLSNSDQYIDDIDKLDYSAEFKEWEHHKHSNILTYRDKTFRSKVTGIESIVHTPIWMNAKDDSMESYLH